MLDRTGGEHRLAPKRSLTPTFLTPGDFAGNGTLSQVRLVMGPITPEQSRLKQ